MSDPKDPRHLVGVWNPSYGADVIESHIMLLRERAQKFRDGQEKEEEVYVWWGKIRSSRRQTALPHIADILSLEQELGEADGDAEREIQLYLTDYRSLYVAHIGGITAEDVREDDDEAHIPAVYMKKDIHCDCWFQLWDIRRLVTDDTLAVVDELSKLHNTAYHDMPVSIYGGMVNLPPWAKLDPGTRTFIATAEKLYRDHRSDVAFDFSPILLDFAKAFEVQTNILLKRALKGVKPQHRMMNVDGRSRDVGEEGPFTIGTLALILGGNEDLNYRLKQQLRSGAEFFTASLPAILKELADIRNAAAHSESLDRESVHKLRNRFLGVGCEGDFVKLAKVRIN